MRISLVIPAYNEGRRLPAALESLYSELWDQLGASKSEFELIVVEDGSRPEDCELVERALVDLSRRSADFHFRHIRNERNAGKGAALDRGFREARGEWVGFVDADASTGWNSVKDLLSDILSDPPLEALLGSRVLMLGRQVERNARRHYIGRIFATLFFILFRIPVYDSQCGCKFFRRARVLPLLDQIQDRRWVWDTQLLVLSYRAGLRMREVPVDWHEVGGSRVSMLRDPARMLWSLIRFKRSLPS